MRLGCISEIDLSRRQFLKAGGQAAAAAAAPQSVLKGLMPEPKSQVTANLDSDAGYQGDYEFWEDMGLDENDIENAVDEIINGSGKASLNNILNQWKQKNVNITHTDLIGTIKGWLSTNAYNNPESFLYTIFGGVQPQNLLDLTGKFVPKIAAQTINNVGANNIVRGLFQSRSGDASFWNAMSNMAKSIPGINSIISTKMASKFASNPLQGARELMQKGFINQKDFDAFYESNKDWFKHEDEASQQKAEKTKEQSQLGSEYESDSWRSQSTEFEARLDRRLGLLVEYTPEQEVEQSRWASLFKSKFPGRMKRRESKAGMKKTDQDLTIAPDPYDTKPLHTTKKPRYLGSKRVVQPNTD